MSYNKDAAQHLETPNVRPTLLIYDLHLVVLCPRVHCFEVPMMDCPAACQRDVVVPAGQL